MKRIFSVQNTHKKTLIEILIFTRGEQKFSASTLWREGSFVVVIDEDEGQVVPNWDALTHFNLTDYEYYFDHTWDAQSTDFSGENMSEEELVEVKKIIYNDGVGYLEEHGWIEEDPEHYVDGPVYSVEITDTKESEWYV